MAFQTISRTAFFLVCILPAMQSLASSQAFLDEFIKNYQTQNFSAQATLVQENKDIIPGVIKQLMQDATDKTKRAGERNFKLNIASSMASMHKHWNNDDGPLKEISPIIKEIVDRAKAKLKASQKWKPEEKFLGNFVMNRYEKQMEAEGLAPVLYPHWLHRILFECKVCHESIFQMQRWSNGISQEKITSGQQCGVCHNGDMAFGADKDCNRCHLAGTPEAARLRDPEKIDHEKIKKYAEKLGGQWNPENLVDGHLPLDRFRFIDWLKMKRAKVFAPIASLEKDYKEETRDNKILFLSKSDFVDHVLFNHKVHADWIKCSTCHPAIFEETLGASKIKMNEFPKGRFCGHCHGKVSFTFSDCFRCHNTPRDKTVGDDVLHREARH